MNIISKFCSGEIRVDMTDLVYTTAEIRDEIEIHKAVFPGQRSRLQLLNFEDIAAYKYTDGEYFDEAQYLFHYKILINKYTMITSFYGQKGFGDISILAAVATIFGRRNPSLFDIQESVEVVTHDNTLKDCLSKEFGERIIISDPVIAQQQAE